MFNLIRFVFICVHIYFVYKLVKWIISSPAIQSHDAPVSRSSITKGEDLIEDPYCHVYIPMSQAYKVLVDGRELFFCSKKCFEKYISESPMRKAQEAP